MEPTSKIITAYNEMKTPKNTPQCNQNWSFFILGSTIFIFKPSKLIKYGEPAIWLKIGRFIIVILFQLSNFARGFALSRFFLKSPNQNELIYAPPLENSRIVFIFGLIHYRCSRILFIQ